MSDLAKMLILVREHDRLQAALRPVMLQLGEVRLYLERRDSNLAFGYIHLGRLRYRRAQLLSRLRLVRIAALHDFGPLPSASIGDVA